MEVGDIVDYYVLKGQVSRSKDGRMGMIFVNTYFLINKIKLKLERNAFLIL